MTGDRDTTQRAPGRGYLDFDLSFITLRLALTSFLTKAIDKARSAGNATMAFVRAQSVSCFLWFCITGGRRWSRTFGVLKLNQTNIPS